MIGSDKKITGKNQPITLEFPITLTLKNINNDTVSERMDSAMIERAYFTSTIDTTNLPFEWEWIDSIRLDLGSQVYRPQGNIVKVYQRGEAGNFGSDFKKSIEDFSVCMMKNRNLDPNNRADAWKYSNDNVLNSCTFTVLMTFTVPLGEQVRIPADARFDYNLKVQFVDYKAIWGYFLHSSDMYDSDTIDLSKEWGDAEFLKTSCVPFSDPEITLDIRTEIAGAMIMHGERLFTVDKDGVQHDATFLRGNRTFPDYPYTFQKGEYLEPHDDNTIGMESDNMLIHFDKTPEKGHMDNLFLNMPQSLAYAFDVDYDWGATPQIRVTRNMEVKVNALCTMPLRFQKGLFVHYNDTVRDVNLDQYTIDSLISSVEIVDTVRTSNVKAVLKAQSIIPTRTKASMRCLDENDQVIMDPENATKPLTLFPEDTVIILPPTIKQSGDTWYIDEKEPGKTVITSTLSRKKLDILPSVKSIIYTIVIDDKPMEYAIDKGYKVNLRDEQWLKITIGLTGDVDAIVKFDK